MNKLILILILIPMCSSADVLTLKILAWEGYAEKKIVSSFIKKIKEEYKLDVRIVVFNVTKPQDFFDFLRVNAVDIISPTHNVAKSHKWNLIKNNLVVPIDINNISNYAKIPSELKRIEDLGYKGEIYGVPMLFGTYALVYNEDYIQDTPKSWNVLWDVRYIDKYSINKDFYDVNIYITALSLGIKEESIGDIDHINNETFKEKLRQLVHNSNRMWVGVDKPHDLKGLHLATSWGFALKGLSKLGESWKIARPIEGSIPG